MYETLRLSDNSKVKFFPNHFNTFGTKFGETCPGATSGKGGCLEKIGKDHVCYASKIHKRYPNYSKTIQHNTDLINEKPHEELVEIFRNTVLKWLLNGGYKAQYFRLNMEGDCGSVAYATAWAATIDKFPFVQFWMYTRSFQFVKYLVDCKNLAIYLSLDPVNYQIGMNVYNQFKDYTNVSIAYMGEEPPSGNKWVTCPDISGKLKKDKNVGACARCQLCFNYTDKIKLRKVHFPVH